MLKRCDNNINPRKNLSCPNKAWRVKSQFEIKIRKEQIKKIKIKNNTKIFEKKSDLKQREKWGNENNKKIEVKKTVKENLGE